ncbi:uncharacterized protein LOC100159982 [Acyrthosiphon pisum]|uniref:Shugoshin C-terminal domain-containing protein n=1 Tax=Acyrthosiphon pisum TaxID=7029 RepID=A0A8R2ABN2_ACYPI|nr:uncharacterized protein LOC100159982 [Acyrthosiphon pisum]XP_016656864.1 uncharacterized protein LOC100159982 [Acyrthosiphon pisum]XP_029342312.1 uncharacterized protein LOC100159982 [Acyrthosiphon pisum]|eukprot:XP_001946281.1 PREDICTED: uncharacterized protein LOC100159982 [Acyrthosiphon pisum]
MAPKSLLVKNRNKPSKNNIFIKKLNHALVINNNLRKRIDELSDQNKELSTTRNNLSLEKLSLQTEINSIRNSNVQLTAMHNIMNKKISALEQTIQSCIPALVTMSQCIPSMLESVHEMSKFEIKDFNKEKKEKQTKTVRPMINGHTITQPAIRIRRCDIMMSPIIESPITEQPRRSTEQPRHGTEQPRNSIEQPRHSIEQPRNSIEQPRHSTEQPRHSTEQPRHSTEQPQNSTEQPRRSAEQPRRSTEQPRRSTEQTPKRPRKASYRSSPQCKLNMEPYVRLKDVAAMLKNSKAVPNEEGPQRRLNENLGEGPSWLHTPENQTQNSNNTTNAIQNVQSSSRSTTVNEVQADVSTIASTSSGITDNTFDGTGERRSNLISTIDSSMMRNVTCRKRTKRSSESSSASDIDDSTSSSRPSRSATKNINYKEKGLGGKLRR